MEHHLTYFGHSAVLLALDGVSVGIDLWLSENPHLKEIEPDITSLNALILTHGHSDHAADAVRLAHHYGCKVFATYELAMLLKSEGLPSAHVIPMNKGGTVAHEAISITLTQAIHSSSYQKSDGSIAYAGEACGVVVRTATESIYHAGDTALFDDIKLIAREYAPSLALLPIGDVLTMGPQEAAIAAKMINPKVAMPLHYNTFPFLTGTPEAFSRHCLLREVKTFTPLIGKSYSFEELL
jgi:L-ascorbate metabolism protein UlaG (beta-lactamase superfamily)